MVSREPRLAPVAVNACRTRRRLFVASSSSSWSSCLRCTSSSPSTQLPSQRPNEHPRRHLRLLPEAGLPKQPTKYLLGSRLLHSLPASPIISCPQRLWPCPRGRPASVCEILSKPLGFDKSRLLRSFFGPLPLALSCSKGHSNALAGHASPPLKPSERVHRAVGLIPLETSWIAKQKHLRKWCCETCPVHDAPWRTWDVDWLNTAFCDVAVFSNNIYMHIYMQKYLHAMCIPQATFRSLWGVCAAVHYCWQNCFDRRQAVRLLESCWDKRVKLLGCKRGGMPIRNSNWWPVCWRRMCVRNMNRTCGLYLLSLLVVAWSVQPWDWGWS